MLSNEQVPVHIRAALRADLPAILAIYNEAVLTTTASYEYEPRSIAAQARWFDEHEANQLPVIVAEGTGGVIVGWGTLSQFRPRPGYQFTCENSLYVSASERGKGIGKLLLAALLDAARQRGFRNLIAVIDAENISSIRLHEGFGYERVAHLKKVGYKFDRWLDLIFMQLQLT